MVDIRRGDLLDLSSLTSAVAGVDAVFHLAALLHVVNPPASMRGEYERVNVDGTRAVVDAAAAAGVQRVVQFSTIAVYGPTDGRVVDESDPPHAESYYAESKLAAEHVALGRHRADGRPLATVLRLAAVYGSRMKGNYQRLVSALARRRFVPIGRGENRRTLVFDADVALAAMAAVQCPAAAGRIYNVTDGAFPRMHDIVAAISTALGRRSPRFFVPAAPIRVTAGAIEHMARAVGMSPPIRAATVEKYLEDVAVRGTRITQEVSWRPRVDLQAGWAETIRALRQSGELA